VTANVVISEADAFMYVVLSKAEKHVPYRRDVAQTEIVTTEFDKNYSFSCWTNKVWFILGIK
jgi:hypothetical protein